MMVVVSVAKPNRTDLFLGHIQVSNSRCTAVTAAIKIQGGNGGGVGVIDIL